MFCRNISCSHLVQTQENEPQQQLMHFEDPFYSKLGFWKSLTSLKLFGKLSIFLVIWCKIRGKNGKIGKKVHYKKTGGIG